MKKHKTIKLIIFFLIVFLLIFVCIKEVLLTYLPYNPIERNKILFRDKASSVQDSLYSLKLLLSKMSTSDDNFISFCLIEKNILCVNYKQIDNTEKLLIKLKEHTVQELLPLTREEQIRFINLVTFFDKNYLFRCDFYKNINSFEYYYRESEHKGDYYTDLLRFITLNDSNSTIDENNFKILDRKDNMLLCASKRAKIWVDKNK